MILISTKTRYALRALLEMACTKDKRLFRLEELSRHQNISRKYLENIKRLNKLRLLLSYTHILVSFRSPKIILTPI